MPILLRAHHARMSLNNQTRRRITMNVSSNKQHFHTIVIGGGQAGLAIGYYLARQGRDFVILEANDHIGASWSKRWDRLQLFTPARYSSLPGLSLSASAGRYLTKDEVADYLEIYAFRFHLPVWMNTAVDALSRGDDRYLLTTGDHRLSADHVVVATGAFQHPRVPDFASQLDREIAQVHSSEYHNPTQLLDGDVLVVGAGNSGAEIALEVAQSRCTWLAGRDTGHIPKSYPPIILQLYWWLMHRALCTDNAIGRRF